MKYLKTIISRDRNKDKETAKVELAYIFFTLSKRHYTGVSNKKRDRIIKDRLELPANWKPDEKIELAIEMLKADTMSTAERVYRMNLEILLTTINVLDGLRESTETTLEKVQEALDAKKINQTVVDLHEVLTKKLREDVLFIIKATNDLPKSIEQVEKALEKIQKDESASKMIGNKSANPYEQNLNRGQGSSGI